MNEVQTTEAEKVVKPAEEQRDELVSRKEVLKSTLEEDVRLNVFVIGVGNAGNQTIMHAYKQGMNVFAINSSTRDMSDEIIDSMIPCFIVGNEARGSGKNIEKGKALFKENGKSLFQNKQFIESCQDADVIVVVSATGGGTGPSISPEICRILKKMFEKKIIIYHGITPKSKDSNQAFSNTTYCINEIKELDIPYMFTDLGVFENDPYDEAFIKADQHAVECIKAISGEYLMMSNSQMIDENDLKSIISEPGYMAVYSLKNVTSADLEKKSMQSMMIDQIKHSPSMAIQKDGIFVQVGAIINCPEDMEDQTRSGDYTEIFNYIGHEEGPKNAVYENYGVTNGTAADFVLIVSGMTHPINRTNYYVDCIKKQTDFFSKQKQIDLSKDAELVQGLVSNKTDKLSSNTRADSATMNSVLDDYF